MTSTVFFREGNDRYPTAEASFTIEQVLPPANYVIAQHPLRGPFFQVTDDFELPAKLYGDIDRRARRVLNTFNDRPATTGVLLDGEKGAGKSLLAKRICVLAREQGIPTLVINSPQHGTGFAKLLQDVAQPAVVFIDEFEKVYREEEAQEGLLTMLDGTITSKKLFVFTVNDLYRVSQHMRNRPGRLFYSFSYKGLDKDFIREYAADNLVNKTHVEGVLQVSTLFWRFNFDMLKAMVEEMNRYNETAPQVLEVINARPNEDEHIHFDVTLTHHGMPVSVFSPTVVRNPLRESVLQFVVVSGDIDKAELAHQATSVIAQFIQSGCGADEDDMNSANNAAVTRASEKKGVKKSVVRFTSSDLVKVDAENDRYTYANSDGYAASFTRQKDRLTGFDQWRQAI
jgi:hypothetical protein